MGYNTVAIIMNDALGFIRNDPDFGKRVEREDQVLMVAVSRDAGEPDRPPPSPAGYSEPEGPERSRS